MRQHITTAMVVAALAVPFVATRWLPVTDLPQHAAQVRLLGDAGYVVRWWTPYVLPYLPLAVLVHLFGPVTGARLDVFLLVAVTAITLFAVAARRGRAPVTARGHWRLYRIQR